MSSAVKDLCLFLWFFLSIVCIVLLYCALALLGFYGAERYERVIMIIIISSSNSIKEKSLYICEQVLFVRFYNNPAPVVRSTQFHYCTIKVLEQSFLDPEYSFDEYFQLGSRRKVAQLRT